MRAKQDFEPFANIPTNPPTTLVEMYNYLFVVKITKNILPTRCKWATMSKCLVKLFVIYQALQALLQRCLLRTFGSHV